VSGKHLFQRFSYLTESPFGVSLRHRSEEYDALDEQAFVELVWAVVVLNRGHTGGRLVGTGINQTRL
jgi:hypothetical protein